MIEDTVHKAWTVRPKWRPWWTKGSEIHLFISQVSPPKTEDEIVTFTNAFFRGPSWRASSRSRFPRTVNVAVHVGVSAMLFEGDGYVGWESE